MTETITGATYRMRPRLRKKFHDPHDPIVQNQNPPSGRTLTDDVGTDVRKDRSELGPEALGNLPLGPPTRQHNPSTAKGGGATGSLSVGAIAQKHLNGFSHDVLDELT